MSWWTRASAAFARRTPSASSASHARYDWALATDCPKHFKDDAVLKLSQELEEECGYHAETLTPIGWFYTSPGFTDEKIYLFEARNLRRVNQRLQPDEEIEVIELHLADIQSALDSSELCDGKSIAALSIWRARRQGEGHIDE